MLKTIKMILGPAKREIEKLQYKKQHIDLIYNKKSELVQNMLVQNFKLFDKTAIVFGGTGGVGTQVVVQLLQCGCRVVVVGRKKQKFYDIFKDNLENLTFFLWDPTIEKDYQKKVQELMDLYGKFEIFINCLGVFSEKDRKRDWKNIEEINLKTSFESNLFIPYMIEKEIALQYINHHIKGHIVNVTSITGMHAVYGLTPYGLSKAALIHYTKALAILVAQYGIVVNGVAPGPIATAMGKKVENDSLFNSNTPNMRIATPEEIASTIIFLASDLASNLNGEIIVSDGGESLRGSNIF